MDPLQARLRELGSTKAKAVEDARQMQASVIDAARRIGVDPPKYILMELIGKGSYGRVYKGKDMITADIVAVKIIDIDESDTANPRNADSYNEFLKEIAALKTLSERRARNINHIIDALPVGQTTWMITEYCGGGSVATLMKPTAPGGLEEKWVIPIVREVAEAIKWVHNAGIIHRDIKCANVLITEQGEVQLCDFGVAGTLETKLDKRSTFIGTLYWMAPELFDPNPSYGKEVDIWAFGCMVYEIATGLPPNIDVHAPYGSVTRDAKLHVPKLEGNYSHELQSLVEYCLVELPASRPTVGQVQTHPYIWNTGSRYPTSSLSYLVRAFKMWENSYGSRDSLFMSSGAQNPATGSVNSMADDEWNFSTVSDINYEIPESSDHLDSRGYHKSISEFQRSPESTAKPQVQKPSGRRPPPHILARLPAPLEKIFDSNTLSSYDDNSRNQYGRTPQQSASDLPLRDNTAETFIRDTTIDLGTHDSNTGLSKFPDLEIVQADTPLQQETEDSELNSPFPDFAGPYSGEQIGENINRRTQDWKFPVISPPPLAETEQLNLLTDCNSPRPSALHELGGNLPVLQSPPVNQLPTSRESLIDLDMSVPDLVAPSARPSTATSDATSTNSDQIVSRSPFELEHHSSLYTPTLYTPTSPEATIRPQYYLAEESDLSQDLLDNTSALDIRTSSKYTAADTGSSLRLPPLPLQAAFSPPRKHPRKFSDLPELPPPPSERALTGLATHDELKGELKRMLSSMTSELETFRDLYASAHALQKENRIPQHQSREKDAGSAPPDSDSPS